MLSNKLFSSIGNTDRLYVDDVFSAYTYTGNGSTQTINNGIDLAGKGGLVWSKNRLESETHMLVNTARGAGFSLNSSSTAAEYAWGVSSFTSTGFSTTVRNDSAKSYVSWTFRKAPKFFDVVTYTGNGVTGRQIAHSLGVQAGFITVKSTSTTGDWNSYHRSATGDLKLNLTVAQTASRAIITAADASTFTVSGTANNNGVQYVAYVFAHDPSAEGIIQCGSFTTDGSGNATVNLGWEPQYVMFKVAGHATDWYTCDQMRGFNVSGNVRLFANTSAAEDASGILIKPSSTGFTDAGNTFLGASKTYIYLAIRRPNKPPTTGTEVYNAIARIGTGTAPVDIAAGFSPDLISVFHRGSGQFCTWVDKLRGASPQLFTDSSSAEFVGCSGITQFLPTGVSIYDAPGAADMNQLGYEYINHFFKRAPDFFDVVCDTGTGTAHAITHNMTVAPELVIRKGRSGSTQWDCWHAGIANTEKLVLNSTAAKATDTTAWNSTSPTTASFTVGTGANVNTNAATYVTYLFASLPGISKVGSYTGNNASQTINCGFTTGARFVLIKRTDAAGDWYIWDTARGIVASNDPHLSLNTSAAEVTTNDSVDPNSTGFIVNQVAATNINVNGATYIFLSIA